MSNTIGVLVVGENLNFCYDLLNSPVIVVTAVCTGNSLPPGM